MKHFQCKCVLDFHVVYTLDVSWYIQHNLSFFKVGQ